MWLYRHADGIESFYSLYDNLPRASDTARDAVMQRYATPCHAGILHLEKPELFAHFFV